MRIALALTLVLGLLPGQSLLVNGDFEQDLSVGWTQARDGYGNQVFSRAADYHPDADYEARVYQYGGPGWMKLGQLVTVPDTGLEFSFQAEFRIGNSSVTCWPVASVGLEYCDAGGDILGTTLFCLRDGNSNWTSTPILHLIEVTDPDWREYRLSIGAELSGNLPGVIAADVHQVRVLMYGFTSDG
ncbi:MAG: hypothetical protein R6X12_06040 [bacterium]